MNKLLNTMGIAISDVASYQTPVMITDKINDQTRLAYRNIIMPPDFDTTTQASDLQSQNTSSTLKITLQINNKTVQVNGNEITPNTDFRTFLAILQSKMIIGPSARQNSTFVMQKTHDINTIDNLDKPLKKIIEEEFGANSAPDDITIKITRK
jgi:hypothetical protein